MREPSDGSALDGSAKPDAPARPDDATSELYRSALEAMHDGVVIRSRSGTLMFANASASRILGLSPAQLAGAEPPPSGWRAFEGEHEAPLNMRTGDEIQRTGRPVIGKLGVLHKPDGTKTWISLSSWFAADCLFTTFADVTAEREARAAELERARLSALERRMNEIELVMRLDGSVVHANDRALAAYGYTPGELLRLNICDLRADSTLPLVPSQMEQAATDAGARFETEHRRKDGTTFPVEVSSRLFVVGGERCLHSLVRDLSERHALEARVAEALRERDQVLEHSPVAITKVRDRRQIWANRCMTELFGYSSEEMTGQPTRMFYADDADFERLGREASPVLAAGGTYVTDARMRRRDGGLFWCRLRGRATEVAGESIWSFGDIDARRAAVVALAESEERLRSVFSSMTEGVVFQDTEGRIRLCNEAAERILGLSRAQMEGRSSIDPRWRSVHEDGSPFPGETHPGMVTLRTGEPRSGVVMGVHTPDGEQRWISINSQPIGTNEAGLPRAVVATFTDITEQRRGQARLRKREAQLARVINGGNDGYFEWNPATGRTERSPHAAAILGVEPDAIAPSLDGWLHYLHPEDAPRLRVAMKEVAAAERSGLDIEFRVRTADGQERWLHARARRVLNSEGEPLVAGTFSDVTARHVTEAAIRAALVRNEQLVNELRTALEQVKTLSGFLPICMYCKKIRDDEGYWERLEKYIGSRTGAAFSHGICPECFVKNFPEDAGGEPG